MEKKEKLLALFEELKIYKHISETSVKFSEVDSFGVVHNIAYLYWLEWARTEYFANLGIELTPNTFTKDYPLMVVRTEVDYYNPARFGDRYRVYSRVAHLGDSSLKFDNIVTLKSKVKENMKIDELPLLKASAVLVHISLKDKAPASLPQNLMKLISEFEKQEQK